MSRSYKYPIWTDYSTGNRISKRLSSKANRRWLKSLSVGFKSSKLFKQKFNSYDICDWKNIPDDKEDKLKARRK